MIFENIIYTVENEVATLVLNRPEVSNGLDRKSVV